MCYYLYGYINDEAFGDTFMDISKKYGLVPYGKLPAGDEMELPSGMEGGVCFLVTGGCDCRSPIGKGNTQDPALGRYVDWIKDLSRKY